MKTPRRVRVAQRGLLEGRQAGRCGGGGGVLSLLVVTTSLSLRSSSRSWSTPCHTPKKKQSTSSGTPLGSSCVWCTAVECVCTKCMYVCMCVYRTSMKPHIQSNSRQTTHTACLRDLHFPVLRPPAGTLYRRRSLLAAMSECVRTYVMSVMK